jgi:hypothetical protein
MAIPQKIRLITAADRRKLAGVKSQRDKAGNRVTDKTKLILLGTFIAIWVIGFGVFSLDNQQSLKKLNQICNRPHDLIDLRIGQKVVRISDRQQVQFFLDQLVNAPEAIAPGRGGAYGNIISIYLPDCQEVYWVTRDQRTKDQYDLGELRPNNVLWQIRQFQSSAFREWLTSNGLDETAQ